MTAPRFCLPDLPRAARITLTTFLLIVGCGYLAALANMYQRHRHADGQPGLSLDDLRVTFHGMRVARRSREAAQDGPSGASTAASEPAAIGAGSATDSGLSRMAIQVQPGGKMRKYLDKGGEEAVRSLETWLADGAAVDRFNRADTPQAGDPSPADVLQQQCMRCHNAEDGERKEDPFGPDSLAAEFAMVAPYVAGPAASTPASTAAGVAAPSIAAAATAYVAPQAIAHLVLVSHIHMLSIPVFTLIVAALFAATPGATRWREVLLPLPMLATAADFASWWLAREFAWAIYTMVVAGAIFGLTFAIQILAVTYAMWFKRSRVCDARG